MLVLYAHPESSARLVEYDLTEHEDIIHAAVDSVSGLLETRPALPNMYGKEARMNRNHAFFATPGTTYGYFFSKQLTRTQPITEPLSRLLDIVNELFGRQYNGILVNEYARGEDYISDHRDNELGLDDDHDVVAVSWGTIRTLRLKIWDPINNRPMTKKAGGWVCDAATKPCRALHMEGRDFQQVLSHGIPTDNSVGRRVSFTFRKHSKSKEEPLYKQWVRGQKRKLDTI